MCASGALSLSTSIWLCGCQPAADEGIAEKTPADEHADGDEHNDQGESEHVAEVRLTAEAIARYGVKVEPAALRVLSPTFVAPARVAFNTEAMAHVGSPLPGRAADIKARLGDPVARGDALIVVESPELGEAQADFFQKRVAAETAGPAADLAQVAWERAKNLLEQSQGISLTEVQKREAEYKAALAAKKSAEAAAISAENRLHMLGMSQEAVTALAASGEIDPRFVIRAPIDGQVIERDVTLGEMVSPERESLLLLANTSTLWVLADIPEARVSEVVIGAQTWVRAGSINAQPYEGTVAFVSPLVDPATRTAQVRIEVPASALPLKPGMFAQVEIAAADPNGTPQNAVVAIPEQAVQTLEGESVVFVPVVDEQNTFAKRAVTVGKPAGGFVPVYEGLNAGEQVVTAGSFIFKAELGKGSAEHQH